MKKMAISLLILAVFWGGSLLWQNHVDEHVLSLSGKCQEVLDNIALKESDRAEDAMVEFHRMWKDSTDHWAMMMDLSLIHISAAIGFYFGGTMELTNCLLMLICSFILFEQLDSAGSFSSLFRSCLLYTSRCV